MVKTKWATISLPADLLDELDKFALTNNAKKHGLTSKAQITSLLIRKFLDDGLDVISKSNNKESIRKEIENQLRDKVDKKFNDLIKVIPEVMAKHSGISIDDKTTKLREKNIKKKLSSSEISKEIKKKLLDIEKE